MQPMKICTECGETKPETAFHRRSGGSGRRQYCGQCRSEKRRASGERRRGTETPERRLTRRLWAEYKLTFDQFKALLDAQGGVCAICGKPPVDGTRLAVDHCHATGVVRALLCTRCNVVVGVYELHHQAAAKYLATYGAGNPLLKPHSNA